MSFSCSLPNLGKLPFSFSAGDWAKQAHGSVVVTYGETVVLVTACMSKEPKETDGFLPLTVEYQAKTYAMGKIPGGFIKKEGRPKDEEILSARMIDRPIRPLFPKGLTNEIQIVAMLFSSDQQNDPDVLGVNGASCALAISDIPFDNLVGAVRVAKVDNNFVVNPTFVEREKASMELVVVGTSEKIVMLEGEGREVGEQDVFEAVKFAHPFIRQIIDLQKDLQKKCGKPKRAIEKFAIDQELYKKIKAKVTVKFDGLFGIVKKEERDAALDAILKELTAEFVIEGSEVTEEQVKNIFFVLEEELVREKIMKESKRPDGRSLNEIRPINCQTRVLPRTHGSAVFTRGQTQSLAVTTLGTTSDEQSVEALEGSKSKHFMLHYSFPPFSVGEIKMMRGPGRREIGHGALAEKALDGMIPSKDEFPYTIRVVSEILESNGSSSMATVCATSLSLMDAGVPIKEPVAGIAMGLVTGDKSYKILTDIAGVEDHCGDMDFKVAGTKNGITAIQVDIKIDGLTYDMVQDALQKAKEARHEILEKMKQALSTPRGEVSKYAPKIGSVKIDPDKIGAVIGPGGKIIRKIQRDYNVTIDIDDDTAMVSVVADTEDNLKAVISLVVGLTKDVEVGDIYTGKITRLMNFGAFCEFLPGKQGLIHISELSDKYVKEVSEVVKEGDEVTVKVIGIDQQGRINLSAKQAQRAS